jgi:hypothetical protein
VEVAVLETARGGIVLRSELEGIDEGQAIVFYDHLGPVTRLLDEAGAMPVLTIGEPKSVGAGRKAEGLPAFAAQGVKI